MLETGNFVDIRFQDRPRYKKPIGIYWLQAASVKIFGSPDDSKIWPYRLPSFLGALLSVLVTFYLGKRFFTPRAGFLAGLLLESSVLLHVEATLATTDGFLLFTITAMMAMLGVVYVSIDRPPGIASWGFWLFCGLGVLLKGPVPLLVAFLTVAVLCLFDRNLDLVRRLRPARGGLLLLLVVLPWFWAIHKATGGQFLRKAFMEDLLPKLLGGHESHGAPPGLYVALIPVLFWPGILILPGTLKEGWRARTNRAVRFLFAWAIPTWLAFELIPTKLPHYILPVFPAISILAGFYLDGVVSIRKEKKNFIDTLSRWIFIAVTLGICLGGLALALYFTHHLSVAVLVVLAAGGILVWLAISSRKRPWHHTIAMVCLISGSLIVMPVFTFILPSANGIWLSREVFKALRPRAGTTRPVLASVGYHEPSLVFLLGTQTRIDSLQEAVNDMTNKRITHLLVPEKERGALLRKARNRGVRLRLIKRIRGFNYSKGRWMNLSLYQVRLK